jgi:zinc and cadmium transporter
MILAYIITFTLIGSVISLIGSFFLLLRRQITESFSNSLIGFAAGALIAVAFLDLFPEAVEEAGEANVFLYALLGFVAFFFAERYIRLFHHHHGHGEKPTVALVIIGDGVHNFIDGIIIAVAFLTSIPLGITTALAVAAHEIPQEIADMGVLLACGLSKRKAVIYNFLSALVALAGALIAFFFASFVEQYLYIFLALAAGHFIYIAAADLIPELHESSVNSNKLGQVLIFVLGILTIFAFSRIFEV